MARYYSTKDIFQQIPNTLLARYFHAWGNSAIPCSFAANQAKEVTVPRSGSPFVFDPHPMHPGVSQKQGVAIALRGRVSESIFTTLGCLVSQVGRGY